MFRSSASKVQFSPEDGLAVTVRGRVSIYEKDGQYQFYAEEMYPTGIGSLALTFEQVKARLLEEGLFDEESKRPITRFPKKIAVITSDTGAAVQDILNILNRRYPICEVILCPVQVQGEAAVQDMIDALERVYSLNDIDAVIIGRGGGSAEDLHCFNSEALARKIYESPFPVISAVGHETDFTICDFVADLRAPTPSTAAELTVPDKTELLAKLEKINACLKLSLDTKYRLSQARYEATRIAISERRILDITEKHSLTVDAVFTRIETAARQKLETASTCFCTAVSKLDSLSPLKTLSRGFAAVQKNKKLIKSINEINDGDDISVTFTDGRALCRITERERNDWS